jgi:hypothetical protein
MKDKREAGWNPRSLKDLARAQEAEEKKRQHTCQVPLTERGDGAFRDCLKRNGDNVNVETLTTNMPQWLQDLALEITGLQGLLDCVDAPELEHQPGRSCRAEVRSGYGGTRCG